VTPAFDGTPSTVGAVSTPGTANLWARGDHTHAGGVYSPYNGAPAALGTASAGTSTNWARGDHVHQMPIAAGRNLLDNGQMAIKQRAATSLPSFGASTFLADRWSISNSGVGTTNLGYSTLANFGPVPPAGRPKPANIQFIQITATEAAGALAAGDYLQWIQWVEGQFLQHLNWGAADAQPLVYSFDIYSTIATTYVVELFRNETQQRTISKLLPVPAGFSTQVVTFPGDTVTAITNDSTARLQVGINFVGGSLYTSGTLQTAWGNVVNGNRWAGLPNAIQATLNNIVAVTNAQLEIGTVATPYEVRRYDDEMQHCLRYFYESSKGIYTTVPSAGVTTATSTAYIQVFLPVRMRAVPTASYVGALRLIDQAGATAGIVSSITDAGSGQSNLDVVYLIVGMGAMTAGRYVALQGSNDTTAAFRCSAEI
jgi:hypothetical protein